MQRLDLYALMALAVSFFLLSGPASASDIRTFPTRITLTPSATIGSITVRNNDTAKVVMQLEAVGWTQANGEDQYAPTRDILVNPLIFEIAPGAEQIVRVGLQVGTADVERSYRIFLQEIPAKDAPATSGITTLLRIGIPIFVPPHKPQHALRWSIYPAGPDRLGLELANSGSMHIQVTGITLRDASGNDMGKHNVFGYVLPGQTRRWELPAKTPIRAGQSVEMQAATDHVEIKEKIVVSPTGDRAKPN